MPQTIRGVADFSARVSVRPVAVFGFFFCFLFFVFFKRAPLCLKRSRLPWARLLTSVAQSNPASASAGAPARQPVWGLHSTERVGCTRRALLIYGLNSIRPLPKRVAADSPRLSPRLTVCRSPARRRFRTEHLRTTSRRSRRARVNGVVSTPPSEQRIANASTGSSSRTNPFLLKKVFAKNTF